MNLTISRDDAYYCTHVHYSYTFSPISHMMPQIFVAYDAPEIRTTMWLKMCVNWCVPCGGGGGGGEGGKGGFHVEARSVDIIEENHKREDFNFTLFISYFHSNL